MTGKSDVDYMPGLAVLPNDLLVQPFNPDEVRPLPAESEGVARLLTAVLADAIDTFCRTAHGRRPGEIARHHEVESWIRSEDRSWLFAFASLCDALGVEATALRDHLLAWKDGSDGCTPPPLEEILRKSRTRRPGGRRPRRFGC